MGTCRTFLVFQHPGSSCRNTILVSNTTTSKAPTWTYPFPSSCPPQTSAGRLKTFEMHLFHKWRVGYSLSLWCKIHSCAAAQVLLSPWPGVDLYLVALRGATRGNNAFKSLPLICWHSNYLYSAETQCRWSLWSFDSLKAHGKLGMERYKIAI